MIKNPHDSVNVNGRIIIASNTDPGWVFLISAASGIIIEKGSFLSHSAIIARELGIPAVVGVKDALLRIKTGDTITLNASLGEVLLPG